ncbi:MAG TPA: YihY/virulence factor BrkB family protein [Thermoleophilaceae bacterium]|jgi:YihY family inner membrane protein|nr:YihY/virulence factor BrkB family protein [Thermoleophilaceae bacterium]
MPRRLVNFEHDYSVTTAGSVPRTFGELEGDEALETLRQTGLRRLAADSVIRFRAADGFSHARALALQITLTLLPALIAVIGLAAALDQDDFTRVVQETIQSLAPGAVGDILTEALRQGSTAAGRESGETALLAGGLAAAVAGTTAMAQVERGANRIYGVERDRPFLSKYLRALLLASSAGVLALSSLILLMGGAAIRNSVDWSETIDSVWRVARWPLGLAFVLGSLALLFEYAPRRRQPEASWLAFGAGVSAALWLVFMGGLFVTLELTDSFGATYGPVAGTIGMLLWAFLTSVALFLGLAFAAQLEAVRAGSPEPRVEEVTEAR